MSFTESFEKFAKWRLREMLEAKALYASPAEIACLSTKLLRIELRGIRKTIELDQSGPDAPIWKTIAADYWQKWVWKEETIKIFALTQGREQWVERTGKVFRTTGLAVHSDDNGDWIISHLASGSKIWRDFITEGEAKDYAFVMVQVAKELGFNWYDNPETIQPYTKGLNKKIDAAYQTLLQAETTDAA